MRVAPYAAQKAPHLQARYSLCNDHGCRCLRSRSVTWALTLCMACFTHGQRPMSSCNRRPGGAPKRSPQTRNRLLTRTSRSFDSQLLSSPGICKKQLPLAEAARPNQAVHPHPLSTAMGGRSGCAVGGLYTSPEHPSRGVTPGTDCGIWTTSLSH